MPKSIDVDRFVDEIREQVDSIFSLSSELELNQDKVREIVKDIVEIVTSQYSSKPDTESLLKRIKRNSKILSEYIAFKILQVEKLSLRQLEYIIATGGKAIIPEASRLYKLAVSYNREDLVMTLRKIWNTMGSREMLPCPKCGFNAITPDRSCMICGNLVPSDEYIRTQLGFDEKFKSYLKTASIAELNEVLQLGQVLLTRTGIYNPRSSIVRKNQVVYVIYLKQDEVSKIIEEIGSRELKI